MKNKSKGKPLVRSCFHSCDVITSYFLTYYTYDYQAVEIEYSKCKRNYRIENE